MGSRLQKLLKLLESNNDGTRKAASQQISEVAKAHPSQVVSITRKVHGLLYSGNWDTRTAAAATIGLLAEAFPHHSISQLAAAGTAQASDAQQLQQLQELQQGIHITLQSFDLSNVLSKGEPLLASGGQEYDLGDSTLPMAERVAKQREQIKKRLGLGKGLDDVLNTDELVNDDDLAAAMQQPTPTKGRRGRGQQGKAAASLEKQAAFELLGRSDSLSARERNKLKRKAKAMERQNSARLDSKGRVAELLAEQRSGRSREVSPSGRGPQSPTAAAAAAAAAAGAANAMSDEQAAEQDLEEWHCIESGGWPFQRLADQLCCDVLSPVWTVRHGAAAGLRELLREQAAAAAVEAPLEDFNSGWACAGNSGLRKLSTVAPPQVEAAAISNAAWLEDVVMHLLCVLALDRFADYVSDQVVVPVRETAAQALAAALQATSLYSLQRVLELLTSMYNHSEWHVRHGAYTGIKYLLASRPEAVGDLLQMALPVLMAGLQDRDDSVQAAAAEALVPLAPMLLQMQIEESVTWLRSALWSLLANMEEELSVATSSTLSLLAALYSPPAAVMADENLASQLPILWPFLSHTLTSVRLAAATCLACIVAAKDAAGWAQTAADAAAAAIAAAGGDATAVAAASEAMLASAAAGGVVLEPGVWLQPVVGPCLRVVLQSLVLEKTEAVRQMLLQAWRALLQYSRAADVAAGLAARDVRAMLSLLCTPTGQPLDTAVLVVPVQRRLVPWSSQEAEMAGLVTRPAKRAKGEPSPAKRSSMNGLGAGSQSSLGSGGGGSSMAGCTVDPEAWPGVEDQQAAVHVRLLASRALAELCDKLTGQEPSMLPGLVQQQLQQLAATSRVGAALVILQWLLLVADRIRKASAAASAAAAEAAAAVAASSVALAAQLAACVPEQLPDSCLVYLGAPAPSLPSLPATEPYSELAASYGQMRRELYSLMNVCLEVGLALPTPEGIPVEAVSPDACLAMVAAVPAEVDSGDIRLAKAAVQSTAADLQATELYYHTSALLVLASTVVAGGRLPPKLNCVLQNLMAGLRREPVRELQDVAAEALAELMVGCAIRQPCPNEKLVKNLCGMLCGDPSETPCAAAAEDVGPDDDVPAARMPSQSQPSFSRSSAPNLARSSSGTGSPMRRGHQPPPQPPPDPALITARLGAEAALKAVCVRFGAGLFEQLPSVWQHMAAALEAAPGPDGAPGGDLQGLIHAVQVVKAVVPFLHGALLPQGMQLLPALCGCLRHNNAAVRLAAARCLATLAAAQPEAVLPPLLKQAAPMLDGTNPLSCRLGAVEVMAALMQQLQRQLVPYTVLLVVPLLRRMSDPAAAVRRRAALCFGGLTALLPLAQGMPLPEGLDEVQRKAAEQDAEFLSQLLDNKRVEDYSLPVRLKVELRRYQQEGINWLSFLRRFGLSGVLADDMGLGKTLQATTIMACSAAERQAKAAAALGGMYSNGSSSFSGAVGQQQGIIKQEQSVKQEQIGSLLGQQAAQGVKQEQGGTELNQQQSVKQEQYVKQEGVDAEGGIHVSNPALQQQLGQLAHPQQQLPVLQVLLQKTQQPRLVSLVVCPSTLVGHWAHEINKYVDPSVLKPLAVTGGPAERAAAERRLQGPEGFNVVVISYESLRSDIDWAGAVMWDYVILDEGHVIRSTKSKLAQAVKRLQAQHRLVLSGTPIQNSALELWSLFDFLMPGFLGAERDFQARFGKLVAAARYSKKESKEAEAGMLALDALHKQVMPFILRRTKAQVLQDLPPKIVTDVMCSLSTIQHALYEDFQESQALTEVKSTLAAAVAAEGGGSSGDGGGGKGAQHVFSALLYLRKLCSHPLLVLDWSVSAHRDACQSVLGVSTQAAAEQALRALEHAPKLLALQDILVQCGIVSGLGGNGSGAAAAAAGEAGELSEGSTDSGHRLLVFAQLKGMLDLVENLLLQPLGVSSLRLDGGVEASARFGVVQRFNTDPTIQVLLLTTHVGGLGLNLTSADTVVFLEHDWNPMKDLQAMDRAHRIGQTRTVNVYRLLMQDTLEQRIMSLQQFKIDVANAVVNSDNVSMAAMDTGQLLDLFGTPTEAAAKQEQQGAAAAAAAAGDAAAVDAAAAAAGAGKKKTALQSMLDGMGELWDDSQYHAEFDMKSFTAKLAKNK